MSRGLQERGGGSFSASYANQNAWDGSNPSTHPKFWIPSRTSTHPAIWCRVLALALAHQYGHFGDLAQMGIALVDLGAADRPSEAGLRRSATKRNAVRWFAYAVLLGIIAFFATMRFRLRDTPLERDEGEYAYGGQLISQSIPLYSHLYTVKLPGTHIMYAAIFGLLGQTTAGIHIGLILVNAATTLLIFLVGKRIAGHMAGLAAAASYALLSTSPSVLGFAAHATHFVVLFAVGSLLLLLRALDGDTSWTFFCAGLLSGLAFLMKQPGILFLVWAALYLLWWQSRRPIYWGKLAVRMAALLSGSVLAFAATCAFMWRSGSFHEFWFWTFSYAGRYGTHTSLRDGWAVLRNTGSGILGSAPGIWALALLGLSAFLWNRRAAANAFFATSFLLFSFLAICPGLYFREHYFVLMLPAVALLAGMAVSYGCESLWHSTRSQAATAVPILLLLAAFSAAIYRQRDFLFHLDPIAAIKQEYGQNPFPEAVEIARYIETNTPSNATIAVIGSEPEIYFYSHRLAATGHIYTYPLLDVRYGAALQKQMEQEIESSRPEMLVLVNEPASWIGFSDVISADELLGWAQAYYHQSYTVTGVAKMGKYSTEYIWGERARTYPLTMVHTIDVLKRNPS
jgi:hypothetical protein